MFQTGMFQTGSPLRAHGLDCGTWGTRTQGVAARRNKRPKASLDHPVSGVFTFDEEWCPNWYCQQSGMPRAPTLTRFVQLMVPEPTVFPRQDICPRERQSSRQSILAFHEMMAVKARERFEAIYALHAVEFRLPLCHFMQFGPCYPSSFAAVHTMLFKFTLPIQCFSNYAMHTRTMRFDSLMFHDSDYATVHSNPNPRSSNLGEASPSHKKTTDVCIYTCLYVCRYVYIYIDTCIHVCT